MVRPFRSTRIIHHLLKDDGNFANNGTLPVIIYKTVLELSGTDDEAAKHTQSLFQENNWKNSWVNGIYDFHHYHSITHEVLGIISGAVKAQVGGPSGVIVDMDKGDVIVIPAGVAHKCVWADQTFKCVGAYPDGRDFDMNYGKPFERPGTDKNISLVPFPVLDPVFGTHGPLQELWSAALKIQEL